MKLTQWTQRLWLENWLDSSEGSTKEENKAYKILIQNVIQRDKKVRRMRETLTGMKIRIIKSDTCLREVPEPDGFTSEFY